MAFLRLSSVTCVESRVKEPSLVAMGTHVVLPRTKPCAVLFAGSGITDGEEQL